MGWGETLGDKDIALDNRWLWLKVFFSEICEAQDGPVTKGWFQG